MIPDPSSPRRYQLIAEIGRGGMADVHLAVSRGPAGFNKLVVIKRTLEGLIVEPDVLTMFLDEARLAARMNHPNVVQTYEIGQEGERYFIAMEFLDGQPYSRVMSRLRKELPLALHLRILIDVLAGLHHAHELCDFDGTPLGVVHRDATPQNVFITYDGSIKVVDFGIAKALDSSARTRTGIVKGKVTYMSPEQVRGEPLDRRSDVFAIGVMLWEAIARKRMWGDVPDVTVVHQLMHHLVPPIAAAVPDVPPELSRISARALAPDRSQRYASALEMRRDLEDYLASSGERADSSAVGAFIAPVFEDQRKRVQAVIESQLRDVRWTGESPRVTVRELPTLDAPPEGAQLVTLPLVPAAPVSTPASAPASILTNSGAALPLPVPPPAPRKALLVPAIVGILATMVVFVIGVRLIVRSAPRDSASPALPGSPASAELPPPAARETVPEPVRLSVRGRPAEVRIFLDGVLLSTGPFEGKVMPSDKKRLLRVEADHHRTREEAITLDADHVLSFDLERDEPAAGATSTAAATGNLPAGRPGGPGRPARGRHVIDSDSPYQK